MKFHSQHGQDKFVYERFFSAPGQPKGVFFEAGTVDGVSLSNTLFFEEQLGWNGLLVECNPAYFEKTRVNRKATVENMAISDTEASLLFLNAHYLGGLLRYMPRAQIVEIEEWYRKEKPPMQTLWVDSAPLSKILAKHNLTLIDYFSLDIEGAELDALKTLDFSAVTIKVMSVEWKQNLKILDDLLVPHGFRREASLSSDAIYANTRFF